MEREQIVREDFPTVRKGWDPEAVRAHPNRVGDAAAGPVKGGRAAAEAAASEIPASARSEASAIVDSARAEAAQLLDRAKADAGTRTTAAQEAADGIVAEAERLRAQVATLAERV